VINTAAADCVADGVTVTATNAGGAATCLLAIAAGLWATGAAISGRMLAGAVAPRAILWIGAACLAITVLDWARRLATW